MLTLVAAGLLVPATAACLYYLVLTTAGRRPARPAATPATRFAVLIPAHNEQHTVPETVRSVIAADYPAEWVRVYVVADNCTDGTATVARASGACVFERTDPVNRGKGHVLAFALPRVLAGGPDAVLILDADAVLDPGSLTAFDARFAAGADVVQGTVAARTADAGPSGFVTAVGADFDNATAGGRDRLGLRVPLRGTGMAFRRGVLERIPWRAVGLTEDAEYANALAAAGVRVRYEPGAEVRCEPPAAVADLCRQRRRWRAALSAGGVLRWVESKPLVLAELAAAAVAAVAGGSPGLAAWAGVLVALTAGVYLRAIWRVGLTAGRVRHLAAAPWVVGRLAVVTAGGLVRREAVWERTRRQVEPTRG